MTVTSLCRQGSRTCGGKPLWRGGCDVVVKWHFLKTKQLVQTCANSRVTSLRVFLDKIDIADFDKIQILDASRIPTSPLFSHAVTTQACLSVLGFTSTSARVDRSGLFSISCADTTAHYSTTHTTSLHTTLHYTTLHFSTRHSRNLCDYR